LNFANLKTNFSMTDRKLISITYRFSTMANHMVTFDVIKLVRDLDFDFGGHFELNKFHN